MEDIDRHSEVHECDGSLAHRELARFFAIAGLRRDDFTPMPACPVDTYWHQYESKSTYAHFCGQYAGGSVKHCVNGGEGPIPWVKQYHELFAQRLPKIWFTSADGTKFNSIQWERYLASISKAEDIGDGDTNEWITSEPHFELAWDCSPSVAKNV